MILFQKEHLFWEIPEYFLLKTPIFHFYVPKRTELDRLIPAQLLPSILVPDYFKKEIE